jgi:hypothetical protein
VLFFGNVVPASQLATYVDKLPSAGLSGVFNDILGSTQRRILQVTVLYIPSRIDPGNNIWDLLGRVEPPSIVEVMHWVNSGLCVCQVQTELEGTAEYYANN